MKPVSSSNRLMLIQVLEKKKCRISNVELSYTAETFFCGSCEVIEGMCAIRSMLEVLVWFKRQYGYVYLCMYM